MTASGLYARALARSAFRCALAATLALVAACGSSGEDANTVASTTGPTEDASSSGTEPVSLVARAGALCAAFNQVVVANGSLGVDGFTPDDPDPAQLPLVAEHFEPVLDAADELGDQLASLTAGSDAEQALLADLVDALAAENANARAQADAAHRADVAAFTATLPAVEPLSTARIEAAEALGASPCALP